MAQEPKKIPDTIKGMAEVYKFVEKNLGLNKEQWDMYRNSIAFKESQGNVWETEYKDYAYAYDKAGGAKDKQGIPQYDGRYQMGKVAKQDGVRVFGLGKPSDIKHNEAERQAFRKDPLLQEKLFAGYTVANHGYMSKDDSKYKYTADFYNALPGMRQKLGFLAYAHNQGQGAAKNWTMRGTLSKDAFGTDGKLFYNNWKAHNAQYGAGLWKTKSTSQNDMFMDKNNLWKGYKPIDVDKGETKVILRKTYEGEDKDGVTGRYKVKETHTLRNEDGRDI